MARSRFLSGFGWGCWILLLAVKAMGQHSQPPDTVAQVSYEQSTVSTTWQLGEDPFQIERGQPNALVDGVGWVFGIPGKVLLWNSKVENHSISSQTEAEVAAYLQANHLTSVKVRVNQYAPIDEWRRLRENKQVAAGWRYTFGVLSTLGYTILPGRLFGADSYNPYTNTINVYSDVPALALEQAAYAKDVHSREMPGTYATGQLLPIWGLKHERQSKQEVYQYLAQRGDKKEQAAAQKVLQPQYGVEVGGNIGAFAQPLQPAFQAAGAVVGHVVGHRKAEEVHR